jgi:hypothetical protein
VTEADLSLPAWLAWCATHLVLAMATHELGHALVASLTGARVCAVGWGHPSPGPCLRFCGLRFFVRAPFASGLSTWASPPRAGWTRRTWVPVVAAGPAVNVLLGAALWWTHQPVASVIHLLHALVNLLPSSHRGQFPSDGTQLWRLARGDAPEVAARGSVDAHALLVATSAFQQWDCPAMVAMLQAARSPLEMQSPHDGEKLLLEPRVKP